MATPPDSATKRAARFVLLIGTCAIGAGYAAAFLPANAQWCAKWLLALGIPATIGGILVLGASRGVRGVGRLRIPIAFVVVLLAAGFISAIALPADESVSSTLWLGLPARAAIVIYGIGLLPALVLPIAYARTFSTQTLSPEDVERVKEIGRSRSR